MNFDDAIFSEIALNNVKREKQTLSKHACKSHRGLRKDLKGEEVQDHGNIRPIFFRDTDRIIRSRAYSRYIDKTQVFYLFENDHITHRVLHVQLVSKIGRIIGRALRLNEDLIEAIALGHDLGHVPYGHDGEAILNDICVRDSIGHFCHNAQSVRLLMEIENKGHGLNLSLQVLDGILAHNGEMVTKEYRPDYSKRWPQFQQEYEKCFTEKDFGKQIFPMTLEACVVRIADVIAYIGRDIEDAITLNLIKDRKTIHPEIRKILGDNNNDIVINLVMDLIKNSYKKEHLSFSQDVFKALSDLKDFNYDSIYLNPIVKQETHKIEFLFNQLYTRYCEDIKNKNRKSAIYSMFLNSRLEMDKKSPYFENTSDKRKVIDFIAGMTDDFFNHQFDKLFVPQSYGYFLKNNHEIHK